MNPVTQTAFVSKFQCLGPECEDNCCNSWSVQVDAPTCSRWRAIAPELLDIIEERPGVGQVLAFDKQTGLCPKLEGGWCGIHKKYGPELLTDTCSLYPRITRALGNTNIVSASLSCPEIARLVLYGEEPFSLAMGEAERLPTSLKQYLPAGMEEEQALALHQQWIAEAALHPPELMLARLAAFAHRYQGLALDRWPEAHRAAWQGIDRRVPPPAADSRDPFFLLIALATLVKASGVKPSPRLLEIMAMIERALACELLWDQATVNMQPDSLARVTEMYAQWQAKYAGPMQPVLQRVLQAQLSASLYPFAGLGGNPVEKIAWLASHYATIRLALMAACLSHGGAPPQNVIVQSIQTITRVLDHLGNLSQAAPMYKEAGWLTLERLVGLVLPT